MATSIPATRHKFYRPFGRLAGSLLLGLYLATPSFAIPPEQLASPRQGGKFVLDQANILSGAQEDALNRQLSNLQVKNGCEFAVVTIDSTGGIRSREYALRLFQSWKIGQASQNNGTLFLVVDKERKLEFMTGEGVRSLLTDAKTAEILSKQVVPKMKAGKKAEAVLDGATGAITVLEAWRPGALASAPGPAAQPKKSGSSLGIVIALLVVGGIIVGIYFLSKRGSMCKKCGKARLKTLDAASASIFLDDLQKLEREIKTVEHTVWECPSCHEAEVVSKVASHAQRCRSCQRYTVVSNSMTLSEPTEYSEGHGVTEHVCANCDWKNSESYNIPRLERYEHRDDSLTDTAVGAASWIASSTASSSWSDSSSSSSWSSDSSDSGFSGGSTDGGGSSDSW